MDIEHLPHFFLGKPDLRMEVFVMLPALWDLGVHRTPPPLTEAQLTAVYDILYSSYLQVVPGHAFGFQNNYRNQLNQQLRNSGGFVDRVQDVPIASVNHFGQVLMEQLRRTEIGRYAFFFFTMRNTKTYATVPLPLQNQRSLRDLKGATLAFIDENQFNPDDKFYMDAGFTIAKPKCVVMPAREKSGELFNLATGMNNGEEHASNEANQFVIGLHNSASGMRKEFHQPKLPFDTTFYQTYSQEKTPTYQKDNDGYSAKHCDGRRVLNRWDQEPEEALNIIGQVRNMLVGAGTAQPETGHICYPGRVEIRIGWSKLADAVRHFDEERAKRCFIAVPDGLWW